MEVPAVPPPVGDAVPRRRRRPPRAQARGVRARGRPVGRADDPLLRQRLGVRGARGRRAPAAHAAARGRAVPVLRPAGGGHVRPECGGAARVQLPAARVHAAHVRGQEPGAGRRRARRPSARGHAGRPGAGAGAPRRRPPAPRPRPGPLGTARALRARDRGPDDRPGPRGQGREREAHVSPRVRGVHAVRLSGRYVSSPRPQRLYPPHLTPSPPRRTPPPLLHRGALLPVRDPDGDPHRLPRHAGHHGHESGVPRGRLYGRRRDELCHRYKRVRVRDKYQVSRWAPGRARVRGRPHPPAVGRGRADVPRRAPRARHRPRRPAPAGVRDAHRHPVRGETALPPAAACCC